MRFVIIVIVTDSVSGDADHEKFGDKASLRMVTSTPMYP